MTRKAFLLPLLSVLVLASLLLMNVQPAAAAAGDPVDLTGTVTSIDEIGGSFVLTTADSQVFTIFPPLGFDLTALAVSDLVEVVGMANEDGSIAATGILLVVQFTGSVVSVDELTRSFVVETTDSQQFIVFAPADFDLGTLLVGAEVEVMGTLNEDGSVAAETIIVKLHLTGIVASLDPLGGTFVVETGTGEVYTVHPPAGFDWTGIAQGDQVELTGILNEDGSVEAASILIQGTGEDDQTNDGFFCTQSDLQHPVGAILAARYQVDYATLQAWFCEGHGWGQIVLALQTGQINGQDPSALLAARSAGAGWGQIWHELGLKGKPKDEDSPAAGNGNGNGQSGQADPEDLESESDHPGNSGNPHDPGSNGNSDQHGNPNDLDGDGHPDKANPHKPNKHNP